jgi:hypothetical protein
MAGWVAAFTVKDTETASGELLAPAEAIEIVAS